MVGRRGIEPLSSAELPKEVENAPKTKMDRSLRRKAFDLHRRYTPDELKEIFRGKHRVVIYRGKYAIERGKGSGRRRITLGTSDPARAKSLYAHFASGYRSKRVIRRPDHLYFIRSNCSVGFIKIGIAARPSKRFEAIEVSSPYTIRILAVIHGNRSEELRLHAKFEHLRVRGEWFRPGPELLRYIDSIQPQHLAEYP